MAKSVVIYSTPTCHFCKLAKDYFDKNGIKYTAYDVSSDIEKRNEMIEKSGQMGVPVIIIDNEIIVGYDEATLKDKLGL
ncbi:MAG: glutaredoxin family protein [Patescibacteria group bacterium]